MKDKRYWIKRGDALYEEGRVHEAILSYESCIELRSGMEIEANERLSKCYLDNRLSNYSDSHDRAIEYLKKNIVKGDADSCHKLANIYCNSNSLSHDARAGIKWHLEALDMGHEDSTIKIAKMYLTSKYDDEGLTLKDREALGIGLDEEKARGILSKLPNNIDGFVDGLIKKIKREL